MTQTLSFAFLHGGGQGGWVWDETRAALHAQVPGASMVTQAFDLPGCGSRRGMDLSGLSVRDVAAHFIDDLEQATLGPCVLVGHSNAGTILPLVAAHRPDLVRRYVYVSCIAPPPGKSISEVMRPRHAIGTEGEDQAARLRRMFCNDMGLAQADEFMAKLGQDHWPTMQALGETGWEYGHLANHAASYVLCLQDQALPLAWQEEFAARVHATRRIAIDAGHQVMNTRPQGLAEILCHEALAG